MVELIKLYYSYMKSIEKKEKNSSFHNPTSQPHQTPKTHHIPIYIKYTDPFMLYTVIFIK
jgi:hypothetical protein